MKLKCLNCKEEMKDNCKHILIFKLCCECYNVITEIIRLSYKYNCEFKTTFMNADENGRSKLIEESIKLYIQKNYPEIQ